MSTIRFEQVSPETFSEYYEKAQLRTEFDGALLDASNQWLHRQQARCYLARDVISHKDLLACGFAICGGDLARLFNEAESGMGRQAVRAAIRLGARSLVAEIGFQREYFESFGFVAHGEPIVSPTRAVVLMDLASEERPEGFAPTTRHSIVRLEVEWIERGAVQRSRGSDTPLYTRRAAEAQARALRNDSDVVRVALVPIAVMDLANEELGTGCQGEA